MKYLRSHHQKVVVNKNRKNALSCIQDKLSIDLPEVGNPLVMFRSFIIYYFCNMGTFFSFHVTAI